MSVDELKERLNNLKTNLKQEKTGECNTLYIGDLTESIKQVEDQIKFLNKNSKGIEILPNE